MALLDGQYVKDEEIDPAHCRFVGLFRSPQPPSGRLPDGRYADRILCGCGQLLGSVEGTRQHWQDGHFDQPQYVSLAELHTKDRTHEL